MKSWHRLIVRVPLVARRTFLAGLCLLLASPPFVVTTTAQTQNTRGRVNTWAARSDKGLTLTGTWTAKEDPKTGAVTGTWTLTDGRGGVSARGGWSAAKSPTGWTGSWRAATVGRPGEYAGTWAAQTDLAPGATVSQLLAKSLEAAVSGTWQAAGQTGAWTIRAYP